MPTPRNSAGEEVVDADGERHDVVDLLRRRPAERGDVLLRHHRIVELVVLVVELDDRARQLRALLDAEPLRQRARRDVAHDNLERDDLHLADQLLAHVEPADEMRRHADVVEVLEHVFGDAVVEDALAFDHLVLLGIEGGGVVLEMLDQRSRLRSFIEDLRLAFIDAAAAAHRSVPWFVECPSGCRGSGCDLMSAAAGRGGATKNVNMRRVHLANLSDRAGQHNRGKGFVPHALREQITTASVALTTMSRYARPRVARRCTAVHTTVHDVETTRDELIAACVPAGRLGTTGLDASEFIAPCKIAAPCYISSYPPGRPDTARQA